MNSLHPNPSRSIPLEPRMGEGTPLHFGRDICSDYESASSREWLVTNGIGGYASGTISGVLTRRYHGLLVAALKPPLDRKLLFAKLEETARYNGESFQLFANRWVNTVAPGSMILSNSSRS